MQSRTDRSKFAFSGDERGVVAPLLALLITTICLFIGLAVDYSRWYLAHRITVDALDAAVLAGGRALQTNPDDVTAALDLAMIYYRENTKTRPALESDNVTFVTADGNASVKAQGSAFITTHFMALGGFKKLAVVNDVAAALPVASRGMAGSKLELSLMLDVTGSMCNDGIGPCRSSSKLDGLKSAAKTLVNIVLANSIDPQGARAALVPFATRVRLAPDGGGGAIMKAVTNLDPSWTGWFNECISATGGGGGELSGNWHCNQYQAQNVTWRIMPCVTDRATDAAFVASDDAPGPDHWHNAHDGSRRMESHDSTDSNVLTSGLGKTPSDPADHWNFSGDGSCADIAPGSLLLPLTSDKTLLQNRIDGLEALGSTAGALGTSWAWYTLSPKWGTIWSNGWTGVSAPAPYEDVHVVLANGAPKLRKVAVLLTDGSYNTFRSWKEQNQQDVSNDAISVCDGMKAAGIEIYTVGFGLDLLPMKEADIATATLKACGSDVQHFYQSLHVTDLQAAFRDIGLKLTTLRLSH